MTKMSRKTHLKMAECLRAAKKQLNQDTCKYVCYAVDNTCSSSDIKSKVKTWISVQLCGSAFVSGWLKDNHGIDPFFNIPMSKRYEYRLAWIDHMIKILEA